jgi:hypothetical protein
MNHSRQLNHSRHTHINRIGARLARAGLFALFASAFSSAARADILLVTQETAGDRAALTPPIRVSIAPERVRIDYPGTHVIFQLDARRLHRVDERRERIVTTGLDASAPAPVWADWLPGADWRETSDRDVIAGLASRRYEWNDGEGVVREVWISEQPLGAGLYYGTLASLVQTVGGLAPAAASLPAGVPLRQRTSVATVDGMTVVSDVITLDIQEVSLAASTFEPPGGFQVARSSPR